MKLAILRRRRYRVHERAPRTGLAEKHLDCRLDMAVAAIEDGLQHIPIHVWKHGEKN